MTQLPQGLQWKIELKNDPRYPNWLAKVDVTIEQFEMRGFRINRSKHENSDFFLKPPAVPRGRKFYDIVRVTNEDAWKLFEERVLNDYRKQSEDEDLNQAVRSL
jgi:hypothetical protein